MSTIKELYEDAIQYEESTLAHYILCLLREGKVSFQDDERILESVQPDIEKLTTLIDGNQLGFSQIKIYSLKTESGTFAFIFADSTEKAKEHYWMKFRNQPLNCFEMSLDNMIYTGNRFVSFRDLKKEKREFPCIVGFYRKS